MSRIYIFFLLIIGLFFSACSEHTVVVDAPNKKSFENEDRLAIFALYAKQKGDFNSTISLYDLLYKKSSKPEYRDEEIITMLQSGQFNRALKKIKEYEKNKIDKLDPKLERMKIAALMQLKRYDEAKVSALALLKQTKAIFDYEQLAAIYMAQGRYEYALKYLQSAYAIDYNENVLDKMAVILYVNLNRKAEAISYLETHMRLNGCSQTICLRLGSFYSDENNIDGMLRIYLRLYDNTKDEKYAKTVIKLYEYKKQTLPLIRFLQKSGVDDERLLELYRDIKDYKKVVALSDKLYKKDSDPYYLAQSAIFEYKAAKNKSDKKMLASVIDKFERVIKNTDNAMYLNYFGYLLIDHDIDVKKGMKYVKQALKIEKDSPFYLDSLAWGYYKEGKCKKALKIMYKVREILGKEDKEVNKHIDKIKGCIKKGKM